MQQQIGIIVTAPEEATAVADAKNVLDSLTTTGPNAIFDGYSLLGDVPAPSGIDNRKTALPLQLTNGQIVVDDLWEETVYELETAMDVFEHDSSDYQLVTPGSVAYTRVFRLYDGAGCPITNTLHLSSLQTQDNAWVIQALVTH